MSPAPPGHAVVGGHRREHRRHDPHLRRQPRAAIGAAVAVPQPAGQRQSGHRRGHGHQHPATQPGRGHRRHPAPHRPPRCHPRRSHAVREGPRLPHGWQHPGPRRHHGCLSHRSRQHQDAGHCRHPRDQARRVRDRGHRVAVPDQLLGHRRSHPGAGRRWRARRHQRCQRRFCRWKDQPGHHAEARWQPQCGAEQPVQADAAADQLRRQHGGPGRQRAAHLEPADGTRGVRPPPGRCHHPSYRVPVRQGTEAGALVGGPPEGPQHDRSDHRPHPRQRRRSGRQGSAHRRAVRVQRAAGHRHPRCGWPS